MNYLELKLTRTKIKLITVISIKHLHALGVELKMLRKLQVNRSLQPTGDTMATGEAIITIDLMATGEAEVQSVQTTHVGGIVASRDRRFACWPSSYNVARV